MLRPSWPDHCLDIMGKVGRAGGDRGTAHTDEMRRVGLDRISQSSDVFECSDGLRSFIPLQVALVPDHGTNNHLKEGSALFRHGSRLALTSLTSPRLADRLQR